VDDEPTQLVYIKTIINKWSYKNSINTNINCYHSSEEMLFESNGSYPFDMIILDIQMGKINGIELAKKIRKTDKNVTIAFMSGMADYVYEGYEVQAIRYILKPVKEEKVHELLEFVNSNIKKESRYLIISVSGEKKKIDYDNIIYFESMGHYIIVHLEHEEYDYKYNISELCLDLNATEFIRTHRSYVVNLKYVEKITRTECELSTNQSVPLSRNSYKSVNEEFIKYYNGKGV
jgi:DNA-binding LytR/AlgR family response regulator